MLLLTDNARQAIGSILAATPDPAASGLRISSSAEDPKTLALTIRSAPNEGDTVVGEASARLFLDATAVVALDDKVLDTEAGSGGAVQFRLSKQG